jgi:hypothetical protein
MLGRIVGARPAWSHFSKPPTKGDTWATQIIPADREALRSTPAAPPGRTKGPTGSGKTRGRLGVMNESDLSVLRERAEGGDEDAVDQLIELAGEQGNLDELRRLADQGNTTASDQLIELAAEQGNLDELRRLADQGNTTASEMLSELES